jgi:hypothetical protein
MQISPSIPKTQFHLQALSPGQRECFSPQFCDIKNLTNCPKYKEKEFQIFKFLNPKKISIFGLRKDNIFVGEENNSSRQFRNWDLW